MNNPRHTIALAALLGAAGLWLMLPRGAARGRLLGALLTAAALGLGAAQLHPLGDWTAEGVFAALAGATVVAALATITFRNPIYCAIWFGMTLAGASGLFFFIGAEFLAVATLVVYAGAILVTFLFVLMLAQPEGEAACDRRSWEAMLSAATGAALVGILTMTLCEALGSERQDAEAGATAGLSSSALGVAEQAWRRPNVGRSANTAGQASSGTRPSPAELGQNILSPQHVAHLGGELFGRRLLAVEAAGVLLLAAVVGAAAIVAQGGKEEEK